MRAYGMSQTTGQSVPSRGGGAARGRLLKPVRPTTTSPTAAVKPVTAKTLPDLDRMAPGDELYFAYGSNMSPAVLTGRRQIQPKASQPGIIPGFVLSFRVQGLPYFEPGFGTIEKCGQRDRADVHGVVHLINAQQWAALQRSEGVGNDLARGYQVVRLQCQLYGDGRIVTVSTLQAAAASLVQPLNSPAASTCPRASDLGLGVSGAVKPSLRYLTLLQEGARHHGLTKEYQQWLASIQPYDSANLASVLGQVAVVSTVGFGLSLTALSVVAEGVFGSAELPRAAASRHAAPQKGREAEGGAGDSGGPSGSTSSSASSMDSSSSFINKAASFVSPLVWFAHDRLLAPVLGRGT